MNINTSEGMAEAVEEQQARVDAIAPGGRWVVPRTGSIYMLDHEGKRVKRVLGESPEPTITRVFIAMGWTVLDD